MAWRYMNQADASEMPRHMMDHGQQHDWMIMTAVHLQWHSILNVHSQSVADTCLVYSYMYIYADHQTLYQKAMSNVRVRFDTL